MEVFLPNTLEEALQTKAEHPEAVPIAGGTDLMVELNFDRRRPEAMMDISRLGELSGRTFNGRVLTITPQATVSSGVSTYPVTISIDTGGETLPAGLSASVRIVTAQRQDVLLVPNRAIKAQGGARTVDVQQPDGTTATRRVQVGLVGDQQTEIVSGLNAGDVVVVPSATRTSTTTATGGSQAAGLGGAIPGVGGGPPAGGPGRGG